MIKRVAIMLFSIITIYSCSEQKSSVEPAVPVLNTTDSLVLKSFQQKQEYKALLALYPRMSYYLRHAPLPYNQMEQLVLKYPGSAMYTNWLAEEKLDHYSVQYDFGLFEYLMRYLDANYPAMKKNKQLQSALQAAVVDTMKVREMKRAVLRAGRESWEIPPELAGAVPCTEMDKQQLCYGMWCYYLPDGSTVCWDSPYPLGTVIPLPEIVVPGTTWPSPPMIIPSYYYDPVLNPGGPTDPTGGGTPMPYPGSPGWTSPPRTSPGSVNCIFDTFTIPCFSTCLQSVAVGTLNNTISHILIGVFDKHDYMNITFENEYLSSSLDGVSHPINGNNHTDFIVTINTSLQSASKEYIVATIMHEVLHAYFDINNFYPLKDLNNIQHEAMTYGYLDKMTIGLREVFPGLSQQDAEALAWGGLQETITWKAGQQMDPVYTNNMLLINDKYRNATKGTSCN